MVRFLKKNFRLEKGFTLTELMIIVVIISFLALIVFWASRNQVYKGFDARRKSDIRTIKIAVEEYEKDHDCYPLPQFVACNPGTAARPYLDIVPCDPRTKASYYYDYENSSCPKWFRFYSKLENTKDKESKGAIGPDGAYNYYSGSPNAPSPTDFSSTDFFGCFSGACSPIQWDTGRPGPECDPNYGSASCYEQCRDFETGEPINECKSWN